MISPNAQLPSWLLRTFTIVSGVLGVVAVLALVSLMMPWIDNPMYSSFGPPGTLLVVVACVVATSLLGNIGPRVRSSERPAYRARLKQGRARGLRGQRLLAAARTPFPPRVRAGRAIGAGVVAAAGGALEWAFVAYNRTEVTDRGLALGAGFTLAEATTVVLLIGAVTAVALGIVGLFVQPVSAPLGVALTAAPAVFWAPTHRVGDEGLPAFTTPSSSDLVAMLDPGLPLVVEERLGDWAHVRAENGWQGWVDARRLLSLTTMPAIPPMPID
jgi:hypothetical protein